MISDTLDFFLTLSRVQATVARRFDNTLGSLHGLGFGDFALLLHLSQAPDGRLRRYELAERVGLTVSAVTRALIPLEKIGLVTRLPDAEDARAAYAVITPVARQLVDDALYAAERVGEELTAPEEPARLAALTETLSRMGGLRRTSIG